MRHDGIEVVPKVDDAVIVPGRLAHLSDIEGEFMIADPEPDFRRWRVVLPNDREIGKVDDVIVDTTDMRGRYIEVKVDRDVLGTERDSWVLVPVGAARLRDEDESVVIDRVPHAGLASAPRYARGIPSAEQERELREYYGPVTRTADTGEHGLFDHQRFFGGRRTGRES